MRKLRRILLLALVLLSFLAVNKAVSAEPLPDQEAQSAPNFTLPDLTNNNFTLGDYKGKQPVLLFFWTTWCPFCRNELNVLSSTYAKLEKEGVALFTIDVGESAATVASFVKKRNLSLRVLLDTSSSVAQSYEILGVPTYILIDKKGQVRTSSHSFPQDEYKRIISE